MNGKTAGLKVPLDVLSVLSGAGVAHQQLLGIAVELQAIGYVEDAGRFRGIAEAVAVGRAAVLAEADKRQEARPHG